MTTRRDFLKNLAIASLAWLWPKLGSFRAPVILYMAVISLMAVAPRSTPPS